MTLLRIGAYVLGGLTGAAILVGAGIWTGYDLNTQLQNRFSFPSQMYYKLNGMYNAQFHAGEVPTPKRLVTNRAVLNETTVFLPSSARDFAGGISPFLDTSILVTDRLGKLFHVNGYEVTEVNVAPPDSKREELQAQLDEGLLGDIEIDFNWMRYNDILYVAGQNGSGYLLMSYTDWRPDELCFGSAMSRLAVKGTDPSKWSADESDWDVLARTEPCLKTFTSGKGLYGLEAGGRMDLNTDGRIVWTSGVYERDDRYTDRDFSNALGQRDDGDYGKVMLVNIETGEKEIIAKGLRNPQGVSVAADGNIWVSDHGMQGGDELNLVFKGANFGFPAVSYGTKYTRAPAGNGPRHAGHEGYDKPVISFVPSIAPSAALAVQGFHYAWDGDILVGALSGTVNRVHVEDGHAAYVEPIEVGIRIRDMARINGGATIVLYSDDRRVVYLTADTSPDPMARFDKLLHDNSVDDAQFAAVESTVNSCLQCHSLLEGVDNGAGPSLYRVCGREPGKSPFDNYSGALNGLGGTWTETTLSAFIVDPYALAPDTTMGWSGMDDTDVADVVAKSLCEM